MTDPFAFMGIRRGADRQDGDAAEAREERQRFVVVHDPELVDATAGMLAALQARLVRGDASGSDELDVPALAYRYGFDADAVLPSVRVLRYDGSVPVAFLVGPDADSLGQRGSFDFFVLTDAVEAA